MGWEGIGLELGLRIVMSGVVGDGREEMVRVEESKTHVKKRDFKGRSS